MKQLEIYNFGPIREVKLDFGRVNILIGPQNAGKSCILKVACHCAWVEKRLMVTKNVKYFQEEDFFFKQLLQFHKLEGYDNNTDLRIVYRTTFLSFEYNRNNEIPFSCVFNNRYAKQYKRAKLSYIPAERNVIATVPNWDELSYGETNTHSFMRDWKESRREFVDKRLPILTLGADYYYDEKTNRDLVKFSNMDNVLAMSNTSSGMQSIIPIILYVCYLTHSVFKDKSVTSIRRDENINLMYKMYDAVRKIRKKEKNTNKPHQLLLNSEMLYFYTEEEKKEFEKQYKNYTEYQLSDIYLEEPEENLFPETQADVMYHLLSEVFSGNRKNTLFIATHSPYILYALNNAIMANSVRNKMPNNYFERLKSGRTVFLPQDISIWQIQNGEIKTIEEGKSNKIQDSCGLLRRNYFDEIMGMVMKDFTNMLSYL